MSLNSKILTSVVGLLRRVKRNEDGLITVEAVLMVPMLFWSLTASYTFFNSYHQSARNVKAAYAIADVVSREKGTINANYIDTLYALMQEMVADRSEMNLRISYLVYYANEDRYELKWSCTRGDEFTQWTNASVGQLKPRLPDMPDYGRMIVVETSNTYRPPYRLWITRDEYKMDNFVFTHPRVFDQIKAENCQGS